MENGELYEISYALGRLLSSVEALKEENAKNDKFRKSIYAHMEDSRAVKVEVEALKANHAVMASEVKKISSWRMRIVGAYMVLSLIGGFVVTKFGSILSIISTPHTGP